MNQSTTYLYHYRRGKELYSAGHYGQALRSLKKSLIYKPDFPDIYFLIARIYSELKEYAASISMYEKVVKYLPNDLEVLCEYGKTQLLAGDEKRGLKLLKKALKKNPTDVRARTELIRYFIRKNNPKQALSVAESGIRSNPDYVPFYCYAGDALRKLNKLQKAQNYYDQCLEIEPDYEPAKRGINAVFREMDDSSNQSQATHPPKDDAKEDMVIAAGLYNSKRYDEAILRLLDLKDRPTVERQATVLLGLCFAQKGLYKRAHAGFLGLIENHEADLLVYYNIGLALNRMGRYQDAIPFLHEALQRDDEYQEALLEMGYAYLQCGQLAEARNYFVRTLKIDRDDPRPYLYLARMAYDRNERKKAAEFFQKAQEMDPTCPELEYIRGYIAIHEEKYDEVIHSLEKFLEHSPDHFEVLKFLGRANEKMQIFPDAVEWYRAAAALNPDDPECQKQIQRLSR